MKIRFAERKDVPALLAIYAPFVRNTPVTFENEVPSEKDFWERIEKVLKVCPWLVCEVNGEIAGYAYAARHRDRIAYQWAVEASVYLSEDRKGKGIGKALYRSLIGLLKLQGYCHAYGVITMPNEASIALHESAGFKHIHTYEKIGHKCGAWRDVGWWHLPLQDKLDPHPLAPRSLKELDQDDIESALRAHLGA